MYCAPALFFYFAAGPPARPSAVRTRLAGPRFRAVSRVGMGALCASAPCKVAASTQSAAARLPARRARHHLVQGGERASSKHAPRHFVCAEKLCGPLFNVHRVCVCVCVMMGRSTQL